MQAIQNMEADSSLRALALAFPHAHAHGHGFRIKFRSRKICFLMRRTPMSSVMRSSSAATRLE